MKKRIISILLTLCMVLTLVPTTAFAEGELGGASEDGATDVSENVVFNKQDTYPYTGSPVDFNPTCDDIKEWSFEYHDSNDAVLDEAPSALGKYTVIIIGFGADCSARIEHTYSIVGVAKEEIQYTAEDYTGEYDKQAHSITLNVSTSDVTIMYSTSADGEYVAEKPTFTDAGTYTVYYLIEKDNCDPVSGSANVTITQCTPQLYFTQASVVLQNDQDKCQLEWVYTGDGILRFGSSDDHAIWVDDNGVVYRKRSNCGTSIYCKASETKNCKSVTAMCNVEHGISYIYYDPMNHNPIIENLDITMKEKLEEKVEVLTSKLLDLEKPPVLYIDAKLIDPSDPLKKKELHNVRVNFTVPYEDIFEEASPVQFNVPPSACDFTVLHQQIDNTIEEVPFRLRADSLLIGDTTLSPFAIVAYPKKYYNLYYDVNCGTDTPKIQRVPIDSESYSVTLSSEKPSRSGYKFEGWSTSRNSTDVTYYMPGDTITLDRDIVLYAVWSEKTDTYTVQFDTDGGNTIPDKSVHWSDKVLDGITAPIKNGWEFAGWKCGYTSVTEESTYGLLAVSDTTASITLAAQWEDITAPVISGIESGKTYCSAQAVSITDNDVIASVTVNGVAVTPDENGQFTLSAANGTQTIAVTDKAGNVSEATVTVNNRHTDENKDHKCDFCGENASEHEDSDKDHLCDICGGTLSEHTGGEATCKEKAVCEYCGNEYGDLDSTNHTNIAAEWSKNKDHHWHLCSDCGAVLDKAAHTSSGAATPEKAEICTICNYEIAPATGYVAAPVIFPNGGIFSESQTVTITCATEGAAIYYTTDGSTPTSAGTLYNGEFTLTETTTVKAIAVKDGMGDSSVVSVTFTYVEPVKETVAAPVISPNGGSFSGSQKVTITCETEGATIYYTTDGTVPTKESMLYESAFTMKSTTTITAIAIKDGMVDSEVAAAKFTKKSSGGSAGGSSGGSRPTTPTDPNPSIGGSAKSWSEVAADLPKLINGSEVTIQLNGNTTVPVEVIKVIDDRQLKVTFVVDSVKSWKTDGAEITTAAAADLTLTRTTDTKHDGLRGIEGTQFKVNNTNIPTDLKIAFKTSHAGKFANLYKNVDGKLEFVTCAKLGDDGKVILPEVTEKGDYVVMLCEFSDRLGDMDNDGVLDAKDASAILKYIVGLETGKNPLMADFNGDVQINAMDASAILKRIVGLA